MSHGSVLDPTTSVKDAVTPRKSHSGPRKRRPKKKLTSRRSSSDCFSPLQDAPGLRVTAVPFRPLLGLNRNRQSIVSPLHSPSDANALLYTQVSSSYDSLVPPTPSQFVRNPMLSPEEDAVMLGEQEQQAMERAYWTQWVIEAAENERARRLNVLKQLQCEEEEEIQRRRQWAIATIEKEQAAMMREMFLDNMKNTQWFQSTISRFSEDYEVVCPNSWFGCTYSCMLKDLESHLKRCVYRQVPDTLDHVVEDTMTDFYSYDVVCPNAVLGCKEICARENLAAHLATCPVNGMSREKEWEERLEWRRNVIQATELERARRMDEDRGATNGALSFGNLQRLYEEQTARMQVVLHQEIAEFYTYHKRVAREKRVWMQQAIAMVSTEIQVVWNQCVQVEGYGSFATRLHGEASDVDLVVFGATEEFQLTSQQCVKTLADHLHDLKAFVDVCAITRASIPLLKVVVIVTLHEKSDSKRCELRVPVDITFDQPYGIPHNGVASVTLIQGLTSAFYGLRELALVLKHFLVERGLNDPYVGGLSSYGLLLMVVYVLQEQGTLISTVDRQQRMHDAGDDDDVDDFQAALPAARTHWNSRYEAQRLKGELIAKEIVKQCARKQQPARPKRVVVGSATGSDQGHEKKPYLLGKLLMDFLQFYGNDFRQHVDQIAVVSWGEPAVETSRVMACATSPLRRSPSNRHSSPSGSFKCSPLMLMPPVSHDGLLIIQDPLQPDNNVGKSCYRVSQVFRDFSEFLSFVMALIVRGSEMTMSETKKSGKYASPVVSASVNTQEPMCRILKSVFAMKIRDNRLSLDNTLV